MENASKALIIAGSILIAILVISLGIAVFNRFGDSARKNADMDKEAIANFNSKITPYVGDNVSGSQVNALIQYVLSVNNNAVKNNELRKKIRITIPSGDTISVIDVVQDGESGLKLDFSGKKSKRVETGATIFYKVTANYSDETGLIDVITVTK